MTSHPIRSKSAGATAPATPLPQSTTTLSGRVQGNVPRHAFDIAVDEIRGLVLALPGREVGPLDALAQRLDGVLGQRPATDHHFQAVVFRRVVGARDHHPRSRTEHMGRVVQEWRRHDTDIEDMAAAVVQAAGQGVAQAGRRMAPVTADGDPVLCLPARLGRERPADAIHRIFGEACVDDAADVVGAEDVGMDVHAGRLAAQRALPGVVQRTLLVEEDRDRVDELGREGLLGFEGKHGLPRGLYQNHGIVVAVEADRRIRDVVDDDGVTSLANEFLARVGEGVVGFGGEADHAWAAARHRRLEDVGILLQRQRDLRARGAGPS